MTNWRERGYVPASDGEDSDVDFSTQEEEPLALTPPPDAVPTNSIKDPRHNEATRQESTTGETKIEEQHERRTDAIAEQSNHVTDIVHVAPIPAPQQYPESVESKDATDDEFIDIDEALGIATQANRVDNRLSQGIIPVFDLCMTREDADEEVGGVRLQVHSNSNALDLGGSI